MSMYDQYIVDYWEKVIKSTLIEAIFHQRKEVIFDLQKQPSSIISIPVQKKKSYQFYRVDR